MACEHETFVAQVDVFRLGDDDRLGEVVRFAAEVRIACVDCGRRLGFRGMPQGLSPEEPMCSPDLLEARLPLISPAELELGALVRPEP